MEIKSNLAKFDGNWWNFKKIDENRQKSTKIWENRRKLKGIDKKPTKKQIPKKFWKIWQTQRKSIENIEQSNQKHSN